jgi:hypothetical protein
MNAGLVFLANTIVNNWEKDLKLFATLKARNHPIGSKLHRGAQRKILDMPFIHSMISLFCWFLAAVIWSIYFCLMAGTGQAFSIVLFDTLRLFIGIIISGTVVGSIVFFSVEIFCRRVRPYFFPDGGIFKAPCTFRYISQKKFCNQS